MSELLRYALSSMLALALDTGLYDLLLYLHLPLPLAAAAGFGAGLLLVYQLSVRWAFAHRVVKDARRELLIFCAVGVMGLLLTELALGLLVNGVGLAPVQAKLLTAIAVFTFNFGTRKALLFSQLRTGLRFQ